MFRISSSSFAGGIMRKIGGAKKLDAAAVAATVSEAAPQVKEEFVVKRGRTRAVAEKKKLTASSTRVMEHAPSGAPVATAARKGGSKTTGFVPVENGSIGIVGYKGRRSEADVLNMAHRMQQRDLTGEVPVASFAYEILKSHPSVREMGLRERMAFLCDRWERLSEKQRKVYLDDPLKGLL
ncbi:hypothetical protein TRVL_00015 [Trypanosoma vivax]|uniref:Uncharacterized protein n=1 Tax=Trypanosoma vivax (strain Y486) TaxID=1055687 RepID=G0U0Q3_TRYVY|nr:hypothetical protein TRVL_00015 [Trypanosoma vivax]CCC49652.1 conserved hypothetical protein [Trypanosoma vivax Y486]